MRHKTPPDLAGRCRRCYQRDAFCLCAELPTLETRTRFFVIRHEKEEPKSTGTARVAALAMPNLTITRYAGAASPPQILPGSWLLFPSPDGPLEVPPDPPPTQVVVLDGTWDQAKLMLKRLPVLRSLPRLMLLPRAEPTLRLRSPPNANGMSTLEAIARAVAFLEGEDAARALDALHARWVEQCLLSRGKRLDQAWGELEAPKAKAQPKTP